MANDIFAKVFFVYPSVTFSIIKPGGALQSRKLRKLLKSVSTARSLMKCTIRCTNGTLFLYYLQRRTQPSEVLTDDK